MRAPEVVFISTPEVVGVVLDAPGRRMAEADGHLERGARPRAEPTRRSEAEEEEEEEEEKEEKEGICRSSAIRSSASL